MDHEYLFKTFPDKPEYRLWMSDQVEPLVDSGFPYPPWFTPGSDEYTTTYKLNNLGLRCDDITEKTPEKHILFAGCEITVPQGVDQEKGWASIVYNTLVQNGKDFRNLAYTGAAPERIISNLFKYFKNYGNPDQIFLLMPELIRKVGVWVVDEKIENDFIFKPKIYRQYKNTSEGRDKEVEHNLMAEPKDYPLELLAYNYLNQIRYLEEYCYSNKIKLIWSSWDKSTNDFLNAYPHRYFFNIDLPENDNDIWSGEAQELFAKSFLKR